MNDPEHVLAAVMAVTAQRRVAIGRIITNVRSGYLPATDEEIRAAITVAVEKGWRRYDARNELDHPEGTDPFLVPTGYLNLSESIE